MISLNHMKRTSTLFLKGVLLALGLAVLALCIFGLPSIAREITNYLPQITYLYYPILIAAYITAVAFFIALYQAFKLLTYIDTDKAFSILSVKALRNIKYCGIAMSAIYLMNMPVIFLLADKDDAPGGIIIGAVFACAPIVVSVFAAVLEKLVRHAIEIKSENDLTV
jgi:hypothetical protein